MLGVASCRGRNQHPLFLPPRMTYKEQLANPKWQKRRLKILERDKFSCKICKDTETELHVHHKRYTGKAWQASDDDLETLCKHCHYFITLFSKTFDDYEVKKVVYVWYYREKDPLYDPNTILYVVLCRHKFADECFICQVFYDYKLNHIVSTMPYIHEETLLDFYEIINSNKNGKV